MCGIAGLINLSGTFDRDQMDMMVRTMAGSVAHRGPDDQGVWVDPSGWCALAQRRLSVIDLSAAGHQPMIDKASGAGLTYNGEIYNYMKLRAEASSRGAKLHGTSDTEVLLDGLVHEGINYLNKLDGMFAFGYFDPRTRTLTLARDLFGEKPLYYAQTDDWFAFASELHALALLPGFDARIDIDRIATYLSLGYQPNGKTIYKGASKLQAGCFLTLNDEGQIKQERYFDFQASPLQTSGRSLDDLADELEAILQRSVKDRMISDVPLGAFLSGGVDSTTIAALASRLMGEKLKTFSIGFLGHEESEHEDARAMAAHIGTEHRDQVLPLDALPLGQHIASVLDEPVGDSGCLPTWILSRMTRQHVTVALSGDGADELFGGYTRYQRTLQDAEAGDPNYNAGENYYSPRILSFRDSAIEKFLGFMPDGTKDVLQHLRAEINDPTKPLLQRLRETDVKNYMTGAVLTKVDRMSMQHALEVRAPFLGREVADFAMRMAADDLCTSDQTKRLVKHLAARYFPREWINRPKRGFGLPIQGWGGAELTQAVTDLFSDSSCCLAKWIDRTHLARFLAYHRATPQTYQLWEVYILELWLRSHTHRVA